MVIPPSRALGTSPSSSHHIGRSIYWTIQHADGQLDISTKQPKSVGQLEATTGAVQPDNKTTNFFWFLPCGLPSPEGDRTYPLRGHGAAPTSPPGGVLRHDCLPLRGLWARLTGTTMGSTGKHGSSTTPSTRHHFCYGPYSATDRRHRT